MNILAQSTSSGASSFFEQVLPLLVVTLVSGIAWLGLTILILQRAGERRRRRLEGLAPLPSFFTQGRNWVQGQMQPSSTPPSENPSAPPEVIYVPPPPSMPVPNMDDLVSDLPAPDLDSLFADLETETHEAPTIQLPAPEPPETKPAMPAAIPIPTQYVEAPPVARTPTPIPEDAVEIMRVRRDLESGILIVDLRGEVFTRVEELDPKLRRRFENVVFDLMRLSGEENLRARFAPQLAKMTPPPSQAVIPVPPSKPIPTIPIPPMVRTTPEGETGGGIAAQIEDFLQHRLDVHPEFRGRSIHIHPAPDGGVMIEVEGSFYEAVGDVRDQSIRTFLQQTIQDWSDRHM